MNIQFVVLLKSNYVPKLDSLSDSELAVMIKLTELASSIEVADITLCQHYQPEASGSISLLPWDIYSYDSTSTGS
jgi:hypothetical protein